MPRKRPERSRDEKVEEILAAAERRLRDQGHAGLSVAGIARDLGVAQNAVYWYFPSRDHLFVAALRRMVAGLVTAKPPHDEGLTVQVLWFVDRLQSLGELRGALSERARSSAVAAEFLAELHSRLRGMLVNALRPHLAEADLDVAADSFLATVEGCIVQRLDEQRRHRVLAYALDRIVSARKPDVRASSPVPSTPRQRDRV